MIIMLAVTGLVLGAVFGFQAFKSVMIAKFMATLSNSAANRLDHRCVVAGMASAARSRRQLARASTAPISARRWPASFPRSISNPAPTSRKATCCWNCSAADDIAHLDALKATAALAQITYRARSAPLLNTNAVSQQTVDTDTGDPEERRGAGRAAAGAGRLQIHQGAVRRPPRHPPGRSRPISRRRHARS